MRVLSWKVVRVEDLEETQARLRLLQDEVARLQGRLDEERQAAVKALREQAHAEGRVAALEEQLRASRERISQPAPALGGRAALNAMIEADRREALEKWEHSLAQARPQAELEPMTETA